MALKTDLIREAKAVAKLRKITLGRLGVIVAQDNKFFVRLEGGGDCTTTTYERAMRELGRMRAEAESAATVQAGKRRAG